MATDREQTSTAVSHSGHSRRRPELDALRGFFLVWMTLTHLPTRLSEYVNQPFGFVSSAEGFVFLSGLLLAMLSIRRAAEEPEQMRDKIWKRSLHIYGYHLFMLMFAFTVAASVASHAHRTALFNLLNYYLSHPLSAIISSLLLIYCPPLLDILPMYIVFMFATPPLLLFAARKGWGWILAASGSIWLLAQFGLRGWVHNVVVATTRLHIPLQETGAFNLFAWQLIWVLGLWVGASIADRDLPAPRLPRFVYLSSAIVCLFFMGVRHSWFGSQLSPQFFGLQLDKWQLGPLRMLNLFAFGLFLYGSRRLVKRIVSIEPFLTLGKASLAVFCAHLFFVFVGLALLHGDAGQVHGIQATLLILMTFSGMFLVANRQVNHRQHRDRSPKVDPYPKDAPTPG
ncbi:OpgC domain-containing protein [Edaphobacter modestus]|uniref:OpgC protein n=1 Tax=Edaphobacter modestus TaxID=388466 RepID=A0A4Q7YTI6_9BACT|nr:OpgC domain-containing protein [Edaphobacter modestus]RZU40259.1 hypothetical protein BDD14_1705 [Edaphobacter modestus]